MTRANMDTRELMMMAEKLLAASADETVSIVVETSEDEAVLIGTESAYLRIAAALLNAVGGGRDENAARCEFDGVTVRSVKDIPPFARTGDVVPTCVLITESDEDRASIARLLSP